ncbi:LPXTG cell wall anchor domain-containing protein [Streptococcus equi subsp. zooepidemicus]|nr:LPXTG cell wall anchor domain-containing protein [Streptococcus equi subsp. zooepidemicus]MCD3466871.1 LPXTG cell wall anchor domain-containing protein [Streptococcus equi subsp. zooepidemicus]MCD3468527.1 LPXTG cell wall anchor domain-containing protein [Streptococcus equi subsp. zooepidemicus]
MQYEKGTPDFGYAQRVINKKITIPQTGGIGTVIFTIAGLAIMIGSGYVMVRRHRNDKA